VQGDVSAGKTWVAAHGPPCKALGSWLGGSIDGADGKFLRAAHRLTSAPWFAPWDSVAWLAGTQGGKVRQNQLQMIFATDDAAMVLAGPTRLFQGEVQFRNLGLAIIRTRQHSSACKAAFWPCATKARREILAAPVDS